MSKPSKGAMRAAEIIICEAYHGEGGAERAGLIASRVAEIIDRETGVGELATAVGYLLPYLKMEIDRERENGANGCLEADMMATQLEGLHDEYRALLARFEADE